MVEVVVTGSVEVTGWSGSSISTEPEVSGITVVWSTLGRHSLLTSRRILNVSERSGWMKSLSYVYTHIGSSKTIKKTTYIQYIKH